MLFVSKSSLNNTNRWLLEPASCLLRVTWPHSAVVRAEGAASISISGSLNRLAVNVEPVHVTASTALATHVLAAQRRAQFACFRPHDGVLNGRERWRFAQRSVLHVVRERRGTLGYSLDELQAFKTKRDEYCLLWKEFLATSKPSKKLFQKVSVCFEFFIRFGFKTIVSVFRLLHVKLD